MRNTARVIFENETGHPLRIAYPSPALCSLVEYYFEIDLSHATAMQSMKGLPAVTTLLAFPLRPTAWTSVDDANGRVLRLQHSQFLGHLTHSYSSLYAPGTLIFFIKLKPGAAARLFRCPPAELENSQLPLPFLSRDTGLFKNTCLEEQLTAATHFADRVRHCEHALQLTLVELPDTDHRFDMVAHCLRKFESLQLKDEKGLQHLCGSLHVTYASLRRYFLSTLGVTPKFAQKTIRFKKALQEYRSCGYNFYYEDFGYTDFSHFAKDARALTGSSPLEL
ncbi:helix-turn-helix domain-containing protein [Chitinophaga oryzae]|uniref:Helix-turn-helix domain-containing protein n=1 Tax=Chitinophaga oryzae TaxID=2725414 RepID=A0ABX6LEH3_9BACT|nr:DUF6597 domain-containing transcriptional factor [Chitinophaga oryzae]QJB38503.1 helix-turn-helix domain-containing protein [Chitinophaga oryzae]